MASNSTYLDSENGKSNAYTLSIEASGSNGYLNATATLKNNWSSDDWAWYNYWQKGTGLELEILVDGYTVATLGPTGSGVGTTSFPRSMYQGSSHSVDYSGSQSGTHIITANWTQYGGGGYNAESGSVSVTVDCGYSTRTLKVSTNGSGGSSISVPYGASYSVNGNTLTCNGNSITVYKPDDDNTHYYNEKATWSSTSGYVYGDMTLTATFEYTEGYYIQLSKGLGIDTVSVDWEETTEKVYYKSGTKVVISATTLEGYDWDSWSDGDTTQNRKITLTENTELTAIGAFGNPKCIVNNNRRVSKSGETSVAGSGTVAYLNFTVKDGVGSAVTKVVIKYTDEEGTAIEKTLGTEQGTYQYWAEQKLNTARTYTVVLTDSLGDHNNTIYIPTATMPLSLYDDGSGNVGLGIGLFGSPNHINIGKGDSYEPMTVVAYSEDENGEEISASETAYNIVRNSNTSNLVNLIYPVGYIYMSVSETSPADMIKALTGVETTWEQISQGRVLIGAGTGTDKNSTSKTFEVGKTDSVGEYNHTLSISEMPSHNHDFNSSGPSKSAWVQKYGYGRIDPNGPEGTNAVDTATMNNTGGGQSHNNIQPYFVAMIWKRVS